MLFQSLLLVGASLPIAMLSGCVVPYYYKDSPALQGHVVNQGNGKPISKVHVTRESRISTQSVQTDQKGDFALAAVGHLGVLVLPSEGVVDFGYDETLRVQASGYHAVEKTISLHPLRQYESPEIYGGSNT